MARWDPWRGCHRYSEGCKFCYIHKGDAKRGVDTNCITKTDKFDAPIVRKKNGEYKMKSGLVYVCFFSDFLLEDADPWRSECWDMIRQCGTHFIKDGEQYKLQTKDQCTLAQNAGTVFKAEVFQVNGPVVRNGY